MDKPLPDDFGPYEVPDEMNHERLADLGAVGSVLAWLSSIAVETLPIIQWLAGAVAIFAGLCAAWYHIKKGRGS